MKKILIGYSSCPDFQKKSFHFLFITAKVCADEIQTKGKGGSCKKREDFMGLNGMRVRAACIDFAKDLANVFNLSRGLCETHEDRDCIHVNTEIRVTHLSCEMFDEHERGDCFKLKMKTSRFKRLNEVGAMSAYEDEACGVRVCFHRSAESLLTDHGKRVGIIHNNPSIDPFSCSTVSYKLCNRSSNAMNTAILF